MKYTIRDGCFETNSSSMHSIVVSTLAGDSRLGDFYVSPQENLVSTYSSDLSFDRSPFSVLSSMIDKACYAIASYRDDEEMVDTINGTVTEKLGHAIKIPHDSREKFRNPETKEEYCRYQVEWVSDPEDPSKEYPILRENYREEGEEPIPLEWMEEEYVDAYVDHQSRGLLQGFLKDNNVSIKDFITKSRYIVIIDGDEICAWSDAKKSGIIDLSKIESEYPPHDSEWGQIPMDTYEWRQEHEDDD